MADDPLIRALFDGEQPPSTLDVEGVIRRSRRRRLPARVAATAGTGLAVVAVLTASVWGIAQFRGFSAGSASSASGTQADGAAVPEAPSPDAGSPYGAGPACGLATPAASAGPLALGVTAASATRVTVSLTDRGRATVHETISPHPQVLLSQHGVIVAMAPVATTMEGMILDLEPGASVELSTRVDGWSCGGASVVPPPGDYQLSASIAGSSEGIVSEPVDITLP